MGQAQTTKTEVVTD